MHNIQERIHQKGQAEARIKKAYRGWDNEAGEGGDEGAIAGMLLGISHSTVLAVWTGKEKGTRIHLSYHRYLLVGNGVRHG